MKYLASAGGTDYSVEVDPGASSGLFTIRLKGRTLEVDLQATARASRYSLLVDGRSYEIADSGIGELEVNGRAVAVEVRRDLGLARADRPAAAGAATLKASIPGLVVAVQVKAGDRVEAGQALVIVEAMKMQMELKSPRAGCVSAVNVEPGQEVNRGQVLATIGDA